MSLKIIDPMLDRKVHRYKHSRTSIKAKRTDKRLGARKLRRINVLPTSTKRWGAR